MVCWCNVTGKSWRILHIWLIEKSLWDYSRDVHSGILTRSRILLLEGFFYLIWMVRQSSLIWSPPWCKIWQGTPNTASAKWQLAYYNTIHVRSCSVMIKMHMLHYRVATCSLELRHSRGQFLWCLPEKRMNRVLLQLGWQQRAWFWAHGRR